MPNSLKEPLFQLVKTMSKSEKRNFRLFVNRIQNTDNVLFVKLFDVLDKSKKYNENVIFSKIPTMKRGQLSNLKRHLYKQILISLRMINIQRSLEIQIHEQLDHARILYSRGLYHQALKILDKTKSIAKEYNQDILCLQIIAFEKSIESRHITRSIENRAELLAKDSNEVNERVFSKSQLSNLALRMYGLYLKVGHIRNKKDHFFVDEFFNAHLPPIKNFQTLSFYEKIYYCQAHVWYNFILLNFTQCYKFASMWVELFENNPEMKKLDSVVYLRGLNNLSATTFSMNYYSKFIDTLNKINEFEKNNKIQDKNTLMLLFLYRTTTEINKHFLEGSFSDAIKKIPTWENEIVFYKNQLDNHRILVFQYKMACLYFGAGDLSSTIDYLNKIINTYSGGLREDIQIFARILHLIAHYEMEHYELLQYLVKSVYRFLSKRENLNLVMQEIFIFLKQAISSPASDIPKLLLRLRSRLIPLQNHPYENRSFLYLDIISWLDSKIERRPVMEVMMEKFDKSKR